MKAHFRKMLLITSITLTSCSTNTQTQNTLAGTALGALGGGIAGNAAGAGGHGRNIAIGTLVGALIGGFIGHSIDSTDNNKTNPFMSRDRGYGANKVDNSSPAFAKSYDYKSYKGNQGAG